jgi:hypothetical protein
MKQTLVLITILLAFAKSTYALDLNAIYGNGMTSEITDFDINHSNYRLANSGSVILDLENETIRLVLFEKVNCPKDMACIALAPITHVIELPIVRSYSDWCDSTTFVAEIDGRPYDGLLEILEVTDFSKISCRIKVPFMVETEYRTLNPWTNEWTQSNFGGKEFYIYK